MNEEINSRLGAALKHAEKKVGMNWVYFIQCHDFVKIGRANCLNTRLAMLQTGCPYELEILSAFECVDYKAVERAFHQEFARSRIRGEWFQLKPEELTRIARLSTYKQRDPKDIADAIAGRKTIQSPVSAARLKRGWIAFGVKAPVRVAPTYPVAGLLPVCSTRSRIPKHLRKEKPDCLV